MKTAVVDCIEVSKKRGSGRRIVSMFEGGEEQGNVKMEKSCVV